MQNIVVAKPYKFIPPHTGRFWPWILMRRAPAILRKSHGVVRLDLRHTERLQASVDAGHGIMLAPNHCRPCDPFVLAMLVRAVGRNFHIMASWHLFMESRYQHWILPRLGVFSIYREGLDREALKCAVRLLADAKRPVVIFPEGVISRHNDRLNALMEGTSLMARMAARQRAEATPAGRVVIHPVAVRYAFDGDIEQALTPVLREIEGRLSWSPQDKLPLLDRILKVGDALLSLKEIEYFGAAQTGELADRIQRLIDRVLEPLEQEWLKGRRAPDIVQRVKLLRMAILPDMIGDELDEASKEKRWKQLADVYLAQQLACYPAGYFTPQPTAERLLETVERFEEDLTDKTRIHAPIRAIVDVGEAIEVSPEKPKGDTDPVMSSLRSQLESMLAASLKEVRP